MKNVIFGAVLAVGLVASELAFANTFALTIVNSTNSVVNAFYASPRSADEWENDLFGEDALPPGHSVIVRFSDDRDVCVYDMRFEFQGNDLEPLQDTQNLCEVTEYEITE